MPIEDLFTKEEQEKIKLLKSFYEMNAETLPFKTDLTNEQITGIVQAEMLDSYLTSEWGMNLQIKDLITVPIKEHLVSKGRLGRSEMVEVLRSGEEEKEKQGVAEKVKRFLGI